MNYPIGSKVWFEGERQGYTVRASSPRFLICTKPFNARKTYLYRILDFEREISGPDNWYTKYDYDVPAEAARGLAELEAGTMNVGRRHAEFRITRVEHRIDPALTKISAQYLEV